MFVFLLLGKELISAAAKLTYTEFLKISDD